MMFFGKNFLRSVWIVLIQLLHGPDLVAALKPCTKIASREYTCKAYQITSSGTDACEILSLSSPNFSVFVKPEKDFEYMEIKAQGSSPSILPVSVGREFFSHRINVEDLPNKNDWNKISETQSSSTFYDKFEISLEGKSAETFQVFKVNNAFFSKQLKIISKGGLIFSSVCRPSYMQLKIVTTLATQPSTGRPLTSHLVTGPTVLSSFLNQSQSTAGSVEEVATSETHENLYNLVLYTALPATLFVTLVTAAVTIFVLMKKAKRRQAKLDLENRAAFPLDYFNFNGPDHCNEELNDDMYYNIPSDFDRARAPGALYEEIGKRDTGFYHSDIKENLRHTASHNSEGRDCKSNAADSACSAANNFHSELAEQGRPEKTVRHDSVNSLYVGSEDLITGGNAAVS